MTISRRVKVHIFNKLPTPYNDMLFRCLAQDVRIDLQVHHLWKRSDNRPWTVELGTGYPNRYVQKKLGIDWTLLRTAWVNHNCLFLLSDWGHVVALVLLVTRILRRAPVAIWADTPQEHLSRPLLKRLVRRVFLRWLLKHMDVVFGTGRPAIQVLIEMGALPQRVINLPFFVDLDLPDVAQAQGAIQTQASDFRRQVGCEENGIVFLMSGQCTYKKGQDIGLQAFAAASQQSGVRCGLLIAGEGPMRHDLEEMVVTLGLTSQVSFLGWLDPDKINAVYMACDVLLHTARWDPFPLVVLEAMSWGKVVIGTDVCGSVQERIVPGMNGFIVPSENVNAITAGIQTVLNSYVSEPDYLTIVGSAARRTAAEWPVQRGVDIIADAAMGLL